MRRHLGRLDGGGKSSWRRLEALRRAGVERLVAAATSGLLLTIRVLRAGLWGCRGAGWAPSVAVVRRLGDGGASSGATYDAELGTERSYDGWAAGRSSQYVRIRFQAARFRLHVPSRERRLRFLFLGGSGEAGAGLGCLGRA
jgi:hypothetical protein